MNQKQRNNVNREVGLILQHQIKEKEDRKRKDTIERQSKLICYPPCNEPTLEQTRKMEKVSQRKHKLGLDQQLSMLKQIKKSEVEREREEE